MLQVNRQGERVNAALDFEDVLFLCLKRDSVQPNGETGRGVQAQLDFTAARGIYLTAHKTEDVGALALRMIERQAGNAIEGQCSGNLAVNWIPHETRIGARDRSNPRSPNQGVR